MSRAEDEIGAAQLGDARRSRRLVRLVRLVECLAKQLGVSIPAACSGAGETKTAYRLLSHDAVGWSDIMQPHLQCSLKRMVSKRIVLCLQDTMEPVQRQPDQRGRQQRSVFAAVAIDCR